MEYLGKGQWIGGGVHLQLGREDFAAGGLELFQVRGALCLEVAADYRFGAARAECHPFIIRQQEFESVRGDEVLNWITIDLVESPRQFFQDRRLFVGRYLSLIHI